MLKKLMVDGDNLINCGSYDRQAACIVAYVGMCVRTCVGMCVHVLFPSLQNAKNQQDGWEPNYVIGACLRALCVPSLMRTGTTSLGEK